MRKILLYLLQMQPPHRRNMPRPSVTDVQASFSEHTPHLLLVVFVSQEVRILCENGVPGNQNAILKI